MGDVGNASAAGCTNARRGASRGRGQAVSRFVRPKKPPAGANGGDNTDGVVTVRNNRPIVRGFADAGAIFADKKSCSKNELHPQEIKSARRSGMLNLSNRALDEVPAKVFRLQEVDSTEAKQLTLNMSLDNSSDDRWWESVDLSKLYLNSNSLTVLPPDIRLLPCLTILDLSDNQLSTLPQEITELKALHRLTVSHNKLTQLPHKILHLPELRVLKMDHNELTCLPDLMELTLLDQLDVSHNKLTALPDSICYLTHLTNLCASHNNIKELTPELGDLSALQEMNLNYNDVSKLPSSLSNLCKLTSLYLCHNRLAELPELNLPSLRELHLANNCLKELSSEVLGGLRGLRVLDLRENKLDELPDDITLLQMLERLDLANNTLSSVPCHLGLLPHLRSMPLEGNPLRLLRRDIVQRGTRQLLQHLRDKLPNPASSYPGFGEDSCHPDGGTFKEAAEERLPKLPDKWQLRNTRQLVYSEKAASVPEELLQSAVEAEVPAVDLSGNTLAALPDKLAELSGHVKELVVSCNHLTCLPSYLATFTHLVFLDVHANRLDALPDLSALKFLRELNMTHNRFTSLPECLRGSQSLEILFAGDNRITEVDVSLVASWPRIATFHINNNNIGYLPPTLGNVTQIRSLLVEGNPFRVPRAAIIAKGTNEIMSYLRSRVVPGAE